MDSAEVLVQELQKRNWSICTAESCTGGLLCSRIVDVAGASDVLNRSFITYANEAKEEILAVDHDTLAKYGAVSEQVARQMALGAAITASAHVGVGITGIAGPGGGTKEKPVGLVYIGCAVNGNVYVTKCFFQGTRREVREQAAETALEFVLECML